MQRQNGQLPVGPGAGVGLGQFKPSEHEMRMISLSREDFLEVKAAEAEMHAAASDTAAAEMALAMSREATARKRDELGKLYETMGKRYGLVSGYLPPLSNFNQQGISNRPLPVRKQDESAAKKIDSLGRKDDPGPSVLPESTPETKPLSESLPAEKPISGTCSEG